MSSQLDANQIIQRSYNENLQTQEVRSRDPVNAALTMAAFLISNNYDEIQVTQVDSNNNPLEIKVYRNSALQSTFTLTYLSNGFIQSIIQS